MPDAGLKTKPKIKQDVPLYYVEFDIRKEIDEDVLKKSPGKIIEKGSAIRSKIDRQRREDLLKLPISKIR